MTQQEIIKNAELINRFMGDDAPRETWCYAEESEYHRTWDWIMPVVEKIKRVSQPTTECPVNYKRVELFKSVSIFSDISEVYKCCTAFVKWYNENNAK